MAILGKVAGSMLKDNLVRNGVDLSFDTDLMYYDVNNRRIGINTTLPGNALTVNGSVTTSNVYINNTSITALNGDLVLSSLVGNISANNLRITNIASPVSAGDAVTKSYVDNVVSAAEPNLTISDGTRVDNVAVNAQTLTFYGNPDQMNVYVTNNQVSYEFTTNPTIYGSLTVNDTLNATTVSASGNLVAGNANLTGNVVANNLIANTDAIINGNVNSSNINVVGNINSGNLTTSGSISSPYYFGDGSTLSNMYGNTQAAAYLSTYTGDINAGNIIVTGDIIAYNVNANIYTNSITALGTNGNVNLNPTGSGIVAINTNTALLVPVGNSGNYPIFPTSGMIRWNTTYNYLEVYTGSSWEAVGIEGTTLIASDTFTGNGSQKIFTLSQSSTTQGTIVSINGVIQIPTTSYTVAGTTLTLVEAPLSTDIIEARTSFTTSTTSRIVNGNALVLTTATGMQPNVQIQINNAPVMSVDGINTAIVGNLVINGVTTNTATTGYNVDKFTHFANVDNLSLTTFSNGFPALSAVSGTMNVFWSATLNKVGYPYPNNYVNTGSAFTAGTYANLSVPAAISSGGDTVTATIQDQDTGRVYRGIWVQTVTPGNATVICERLM